MSTPEGRRTRSQDFDAEGFEPDSSGTGLRRAAGSASGSPIPASRVDVQNLLREAKEAKNLRERLTNLQEVIANNETAEGELSANLEAKDREIEEMKAVLAAAQLEKNSPVPAE